MGLFENIFKKSRIERQMAGYWRTLSTYTPVYTSYEGGLYEMALVRASIHSFATHVSKLKPEVQGPGNEAFARMLQFQPNPYQDTSKFLYRLATIYSVQNNAFIAPLYDDRGAIAGYFPLLPQNCSIRDVDGTPYLRYQFAGGQWGAIELVKAGIINQMQYRDDFFGEDNRALYPTMQAMHSQNEGIIEGVKNSASIRFLARLNGVFKSKDITEERERFNTENLGMENTGGVALFDNKYADVQPIESHAVLVNAAQIREIKNSVFTYFGTNDEIIQNNYTSSAKWGAYYEGKIEPFAIQLSLVMSNMTFSQRERAYNNAIVWTANRLQYATNEEKLNIVSQLTDRGLLNGDESREIFNMPALPDGLGKKYYIRKDYAEVNNLNKDEGGNINAVQAGATGVQDDSGKSGANE